MRALLISALGITLLAGVSAKGAETEESVEIPLEDIWALDMPGTRDIAGIELPETPNPQFPGWGFADFKTFREKTIDNLRTALAEKSPAAKAQAGFVFPTASGVSALTMLNRIAEAVASRNSAFRGNKLPSDREAYVVFYSHPASYYVRLINVKRKGSRIDLEYAFEPHFTVESTSHLALIPLGRLPSGEYEVRIWQRPMDDKYAKAGFVRVTDPQSRRLVCQPFSFDVVNDASEAN